MKIALLALLAASLPGRVVAAAEPSPDRVDARVERIVAAISEERLRALDEQLVAFGTRNTLSDAGSTTRGIGAARAWLLAELKRSSPKLEVSFDTYRLGRQGRITRPVELRNVIAILPGRSARRIYVAAHYDSLNLGDGGQLASNVLPPGTAPPDRQLQPRFDHDAYAPGANDNGSGVALTLELARVFAQSDVNFDATLVFALWAGEEQGLVGSRAHVQALRGSTARIDAVFNNDIVGNSSDGSGNVDAQSVRVYSAGPEDSASRSLARHVERAAALYVPTHDVRPMAREDRFSRGSDHSSFSSAGHPAVGFREARENFARQHAATDTLDGVDFRYLAQNARVNAAAVASLALAPAAPVVIDDRKRPLLARDPSGYDATLRWMKSEGATAYRVYWRETWSNDWQHSEVVGDVAQFTIRELSIDDYVFGVAALSADGQQSPVSAYVARPRTDPVVRMRKTNR